MSTPLDGATRNVVLELDGLHWATQKYAVEAKLGRRPGVVAVVANPAAQTATVTYDAATTTTAELAQWIKQCGYHFRGESVPDHLCAPVGPDPVADDHTAPAVHTGHQGHHVHQGHDMSSMTGPKERTGSPAEVMGHGGHGEMSMAAMVRDMRNRFMVAVVFGVVITLWSMIGREVLNFSVPAPFGLRDDVFQLVLSLPSSATHAPPASVGAGGPTEQQ